MLQSAVLDPSQCPFLYCVGADDLAVPFPGLLGASSLPSSTAPVTPGPSEPCHLPHLHALCLSTYMHSQHHICAHSASHISTQHHIYALSASHICIFSITCAHSASHICTQHHICTLSTTYVHTQHPHTAPQSFTHSAWPETPSLRHDLSPGASDWLGFSSCRDRQFPKLK